MSYKVSNKINSDLSCTCTEEQVSFSFSSYTPYLDGDTERVAIYLSHEDMKQIVKTWIKSVGMGAALEEEKLLHDLKLERIVRSYYW